MGISKATTTKEVHNMKNAVKYCVAQLYVNKMGAHVTYYAYSDDAYGLHRVSDINDNNVLWYDTVDEASKNKMNYSDCVVPYIK